MAIGAITSTGKQNVESGGGAYLVTMRWSVKVDASTTLTMRVYAYTGRMINNVNDFVDYIIEKGYQHTELDSYYPCIASLAYTNKLITGIQLIGEKEVGDRRLYLDYFVSGAAGYSTAEPNKMISLTCTKL